MDKKKHNSSIYCLQETHIRLKVIRELKGKRWKTFHANRNEKKTGAEIRMSNKIDFKTKNVKKMQRRTLHNFKGINPRREYNNCKYLHA